MNILKKKAAERDEKREKFYEMRDKLAPSRKIQIESQIQELRGKKWEDTPAGRIEAKNVVILTNLRKEDLSPEQKQLQEISDQLFDIARRGGYSYEDKNESFLNTVIAVPSLADSLDQKFKAPAQIDSLNRVRQGQINECLTGYGIVPQTNTSNLLKLIKDRKFVEFAEKTAKPTCADEDRIHLDHEITIKTVSNPDLPLYLGEDANSGEMNVTEMRDEINKSFDKYGNRSKPFEISYCDDFAKKGLLPTKAEAKKLECGGHAAVIVGRMKDPSTGACLYNVQSAGVQHYIEGKYLFHNTATMTWIK